MGAHADPINTVHSLVVLEPRSQWEKHGYESQAGIEQAIREKLDGMPGIMTNMTQPIQLSVDELVGGVKSELAVKLYGDDLDTLKQKADEIAAVLRQVPGAADVRADQVIGAPQVRIRPDRDALARYGISMERVQKRIRNAVGGTAAGQIFEGVRRFDVYVRYQEQDRKDLEAMSNILIEAPGGAEVPLSQLAELEKITGPRQISRENAQRYITVQ
ncbi:CusA/CzcA family heavy metal efflux RND transporter, partial [Halobacillus litoralis]|nr:CusA/CzcA family heavy metal efflux RND transporter [Halobacillus litoralis]